MALARYFDIVIRSSAMALAQYFSIVIRSGSMALARLLTLLASSFLIISLLGCAADISTTYHVASAVHRAHNL
jgi:hypothetical protein